MKGIDPYSQIESLEGRIAPAGLITVTFENGALVVTGGNDSHDFAIRVLDAETIRISSQDGSTFALDGAPATDSLTLLLTKPLKSLSVTLGSAADQLSVAGLNVTGDIAIDLGDGLNALTLDSITAKGGVEINGGAGGDDIEIEGALTLVKKDLIIDLGDGENGFHPQAALLDVGGSLSYTGGSGIDNVSVVGSVKVKGSAGFDWGAGANNFSSQLLLISSLSVGKDLVFNSSASTSAVGDDTIIGLGGFTLNVKGALRLVDGAGDLDMNPAVGPGLIARIGSANIVTGGGEAKVGFANSAISSKSVVIDASESSKSEVALGGFTGSFTANLTYIGGAGNDTLNMQLLSAGSGKGLSNLKLDLGNGDNNVTAFSFGGFFKNVSVTGGAGIDNLQLAAIGATINNIVINNGDGAAATQIQLAGSKVTGGIKVTNGTGAGTGLLGLGFLESQIGGISYVSNLAQNTVGIGDNGGIFASNAFIVKKAFEVVTGDGNDFVGLQGVANAKFLSGIKLTLGDGDNQAGGLFANTVSKSLTVTGGDGADSLEFGGTGSLGAVNLSLGAGANSAGFGGQTVPLALSSLKFDSESDGMTTDNLALARVQVLGKLDATFGSGVSTLKIDDSVIDGPFTADTGAGGDFVLIDIDDSNAATNLSKPVNIILGEGDDALTLGGNNVGSSLVKTKSTFKADGGAGTNMLTNSPSNTFAKDPVFEGFQV
jgi:hypothetical protein